MKIMSDEEVFGSQPAVMSDEEVFGKPSAAGPTKPMSDAEVFGAQATPLPRARPEEAPSMTAAVENAPLPRERPIEAPARQEPSSFAPSVVGKEEAAAISPLYESVADVGRSFKRGVHSFRQGIDITRGGAEARPLNNLTDIEGRLAKGERPEDIPDAEDLFGARFMSPEQRAGLKEELRTNIAGSVKGVAAREADIKALPVPPEVAKVANAKTFKEGWEAFKEAPIKVIAHLGAESLPQAAPAIAGGLVAGPIGGLTAAGAMTGAGSYGTDYASEILDGLRDAKVDLSDPKAIAKAMEDSALMKRIGEKAHAHAAVVGAVDAASMKLAGTSLLPKAVRPTNVAAEKLLELPLQAPLQGAAGAAGEAGGQQAAGDPVKPGAILAEFFGEFAGAPGEVATAAMAKGEPSAVKPTSLAVPVVSEADIAAQVAAGGIQVSDPGGPSQPIPTATPVTTVANGVKTTTTVHGPKGAYEVGADPVTAQPTLKPTMSEGEWIDTVNNQATTLYPDVTGADGTPIISPQAMAFENGAHGYPIHQGLPLDTPIDTVMAAYEQGQQYTAGIDAGMPMAAEREAVPVEGLYSRLQRWVSEKGPAKLPANEWLAKLKNTNDFKAEEVQDLHLEEYLEGRKGQHVTREELLAHATAMTAPLVEVTRTPLTVEEKATQHAAINSQIMAIMAADPTATAPEGGPNYDHPLVGPLIDQHVNLDSAAQWAKYEAYTTPGPRESYTELTLHLPRRGETVAPAIRPGPGQVKVVGEDVYGAHYAEPNEVVSIRLTRRTGVNGESIAVLEEGQSDVLQALKSGAEMPEMVYAKGWPALGVTRFLMWAAKEGITQIAWANSTEQMRRYPQGTQEQVAARRRGMEHFYDKTVPSIMKKWARDLGGTITTTMIPDTSYEVRPWSMDPNTGMVTAWGVFDPRRQKPIIVAADQVAAEEYAQRNIVHTILPSMVLPQSAVDTINAGMPSYSREDFSSAPEGASVGATSTASPLTRAAVEPLVKAINSLIRKLSLGVHTKVVLHNGTINWQEKNDTGQLETVRKPNALGMIRYIGPMSGGKRTAITNFEIHINVGLHRSAMGVWATMAHEVGHAVMYSTFRNTSDKVRMAVQASYDEYYKKTHPDITMEELLRMQSNAAFLVDRFIQNNGQVNVTQLKELTPEQQKYWTGYSEWFAEQVAKWATTSEKPLSHVDGFFKGIAEKLKLMLKVASDMFGMQYEPNKELKAFLDSFLESDIAKQMGPHIATQTTQSTTVKNATQMEPEDTAVAAQPETAAGDDGVNGVFDGRPPKEAQQAKAYADKFNWMWKTFTGIHQLAAANRHIRALAEYVDTVRAAQQVKQQIKIRSDEVLRKWTRLGETQADAVSKLLDEVQYMTYLSDVEKKAKVARHPTMPELLALAQKHGVTKAGLAVYAEVGKSFQEFLTRLEDVLRRDAMKMSDTIQRDLKLVGITKHMAALRAKPYFPSMRFGSYTLVVRNAKGSVIHFETFESERTRRSAMRAIQSSIAPDDVMQVGFLDKTVRPLLGVPTQLLDMMSEKLKLNNIQRDQLEQLKFELSPAESFRHRFQHKKMVAGYSMDFRRAYAKYFFHGANHLMKAQYADRLRALAKMAKAEVAKEPDITKREKIVAYMTSHTDAWLDPKPDWAALSGVAFHFHLAWSAAAATQNLTQTLLTSHPFLGAKFGRVSATAALVNATRGLENFYRKRTLERHTNFAQKALFQGMEEGVIKETQAVELAGYADGGLLGAGFGGNKVQRAIVKFNEWGAFMFEMSEQFNRRVVFRATLDLAMKNPQARYVREAVARNNLIFQARRAEGWTENEAAAYVTAVDATKETQFEYGKEFAAPVARGKARSLLVFKTFQQSYFMFLVNNRDARIHSLLVLGLLGGFMGAPFAEELKQLLKIIGWMVFGKDWDITHEARKHIIELLGEKNGEVAADLMLHGGAKRGFGMHDVGDMLFGTNNPIPMFDRSKAMAFGGFLPVELDKFFGPPLQTTEKAVAEQAQKASGAIFGVGFAAYSAMRDTQLSWKDAKRWEAIMPRAIRNVSMATRGAVSGGERTKTGGQIIEYDPRDPQGAAELIGMGMGYSPYRKNYEWEKAMAKHDAAKMIDIQRTQIVGQFSNAVLGKDPQERASMLQAVRDFNKGLEGPERAKAITSDSLEKSVETKARDRALKERGLSSKTSDIPIYRDVESKMFPGQNRTLTKVKPGLTP